MLLLFAMNLAQTAEPVRLAPVEPISYVVLADEARRDRLDRSLAGLAARGFRTEAATEGGMHYVGCVSSWRDHPDQSRACIQARLPNSGDRTLVVLNTYERPVRPGETVVTCIGSGGAEVATLSAESDLGDAAALQACMVATARAESVPRVRFGVSFTRELQIADVAEARRVAASVVTVAIDHVGIPRGVRGGCLVQGRVTGIVRGAGLTPRGRIELGVPCFAGPNQSGPRMIRQGDLRAGTFASIYLSDSRQLLDIEPLNR